MPLVVTNIKRCGRWLSRACISEGDGPIPLIIFRYDAWLRKAKSSSVCPRAASPKIFKQFNQNVLHDDKYKIIPISINSRVYLTYPS